MIDDIHVKKLENIQGIFIEFVFYLRDGAYPQIKFPHDLLFQRLKVSCRELLHQ